VTLTTTYSKHPVIHKASSAKLFALMALIMLISEGVNAFEITEWRLRTSVYTKHWDPDPEHNNSPGSLNLEFKEASGWLYGAAFFDNSFDQFSQYVYVGREWSMFSRDWAYVKVTGGLIHGYKEPYEDKIPLNGLGIAPAIVPTIGVKYKRVHSELQILGLAAITLTVGFDFGHKSD
jgi:hypothetical protein